MYIFSLLYTVFKINNIVFSMFLYKLLKKPIKLKKICERLQIFVDLLENRVFFVRKTILFLQILEFAVLTFIVFQDI